MTQDATYGDPRYGEQEFAGVAVEYDDPIQPVNITAPIGAVTANPVVVTWEFVDGGLTQVEYRLVAETATGILVDTGWVSSTKQSYSIDLVAAGFAGDVDVTFTVTAHASSRGNAGTDTELVTVSLGQPVVAFIEPDPHVVGYPEATVTCRWSYVDSESRPQAKSRVRLLLGQQLLYDSGWVKNTAQTWSIPYLLFDGSKYTVGLTVENDFGVKSVGAT